MTKKNFKLSEIKIYCVTTISIFCFLILIIFSKDIKNEAAAAIDNCLKVIIPSLFSMLTVSFFILSIKLPISIEKAADLILSPLFGLSGNCIKAAFLGLTGGYNVAPRASCMLYEQGKISEEQAKRLALFFSSPGASFCINITGIAVYNDKAIGLRLFVSGIIADLIICMVYNLLKKNREKAVFDNEKASLAVCFTEAVSSSSKAIISICSWIILFSAVKAVAKGIVNNSIILTAIELFSEVSSAVVFSSKNFSLPVTAFCLYFGGVSVFLQQLPDIIKLKIKPLLFLYVKLCRASLGTLLICITYILFPASLSVFKPSAEIRMYSANPIGSLSLLLLCVVFIMNTKNTLSGTEKTAESSSVLQY